MAIQNITNVAKEIAPELAQRIEFLITILQAAGIIFLLYLIYNIFIGILEWKNNRRIKHMHDKIETIEKKISTIEKAIKKRK
jgi:hypothetical protein